MSIASEKYFDYFGNMELSDETQLAVERLAALAQPTRLKIFRLLVEAGRNGLPAGAIGERLGIVPATLSFHLSQLSQAELLTSTREGRSIIYCASFSAMYGLIGYLSQNCCRGEMKKKRRAVHA